MRETHWGEGCWAAITVTAISKTVFGFCWPSPFFHMFFTMYDTHRYTQQCMSFCDHSANSAPHTHRYTHTYFSVAQVSLPKSSDPYLLSIYFPSLNILSTPLWATLAVTPSHQWRGHGTHELETDGHQVKKQKTKQLVEKRWKTIQGYELGKSLQVYVLPEKN